MLGADLVIFHPFDFDEEIDAIHESHDEIGEIDVADAEIIVRDREFQVVVACVESDGG